MKILPDLGEAKHRLIDPAGKHVERDEFTDAQTSVDDQSRAEIESHTNPQID
jgi:hypothetical protein